MEPTQPAPVSMDNAFLWPVRVYFEDTDAGQVVYHARYLHFMERARSEWLRASGVDQTVVRQQHGLLFVVVRSDIKWLSPARYDDLLWVSVENVSVGRASLQFEQRIWRQAQSPQQPLLSATVKAAAVTDNTLKPARMPADVHQQFIQASRLLSAR